MSHSLRILPLIALLFSFALPVLAEPTAKRLFASKSRPSAQSPAVFGTYNKGCLAGAVRLPETGPRWQAMRLTRNRNWGHPNAIRFIERLSQAAVTAGWNGLYIGDIGQPRGGPVSGHASHQLGLDIDIWMKPAIRLDYTKGEREHLSSINVRSANQRNINSNWTLSHHDILRAAARDADVARIFVTPPVKLKMCSDEKGDRTYLRKIRPYWGHNTHFHVRLRCPRGVSVCKEQDPPPPGDGCSDAIWWVTEALKPAKPDPNAPKPKPKRPLMLADLPRQCAAVLQ